MVSIKEQSKDIALGVDKSQEAKTSSESDLDKVYHTPEGEPYTLSWIIWHVLEHEIHHRGELSLVLGLLGRDGLDV